MHVMDGSVMPANPGVNPSLTITALAERAMSLWPNKGETDTGRPWAPATSASTRSCRNARSRPQRDPERDPDARASACSPAT
jgi:choline dehydrogenase-like flavoprotein